MEGVHPNWLVALALGLGLVPILVSLATAYVKVSIVFNLLRSGLGAPQVPGATAIMVLSLALTLFIMRPVIEETVAIGEQLDISLFQSVPSGMSLEQLLPLLDPWRRFLTERAGSRELEVLEQLDERNRSPLEIALEQQSEQKADLQVLFPAYLLTELREAFTMGFVLLLPFLVIDLAVANILVGLGMFMVSPTMVSLPLKIILFVVVDGWLLLSKGLVQSYLV